MSQKTLMLMEPFHLNDPFLGMTGGYAAGKGRMDLASMQLKKGTDTF